MIAIGLDTSLVRQIYLWIAGYLDLFQLVLKRNRNSKYGCLLTRTRDLLPSEMVERYHLALERSQIRRC